jgi:hypothetical protein
MIRQNAIRIKYPQRKAQTSSFIHQPLDLKTTQIRLLRLTISSIEILTGDIEHFDFNDDCPPYKAVSYMWGPCSPTRIILLNGASFQVRENLWLFLLERSRTTESRDCLLWIDQICIYQSSSAERNHQVKMMGQIYRRAEAVLIWLGREDYHGDRQALRNLPDSRNLEHPSLLAVSDQCFRVWSLCWRPYWRRLWVIQEIVLGHNITVMCGKELIPWDNFVNCLDGSSDPRAGLMAPRFVPEVVLDIAREKRFYDQAGASSTLRYILDHFMKSECENPRDKVYGLLGLVKESKTVVIDYQKPVRDIYIDVVKTATKQENPTSSDVLPLTKFCSDLRQILDLNRLVSDGEIEGILGASYGKFNSEESKKRESLRFWLPFFATSFSDPLARKYKDLELEYHGEDRGIIFETLERSHGNVELARKMLDSR